MFLLHNGIPETEVDILFMKAIDLPSALINGEIDAFSMRNPFIAEASAALGQNGLELFEPGAYRQTFNLCVRKAFLSAKPELIDRILEADNSFALKEIVIRAGDPSGRDGEPTDEFHMVPVYEAETCEANVNKSK